LSHQKIVPCHIGAFSPRTHITLTPHHLFNNMGKILLIVTVVVSLAAAGLGFLNQGKLAEANLENEQLTGERNTLRKDLETTRGELSTAQENLAEMTKEKDDLQAKLNAANSSLEEARAQVTQANSQLEETKEQLGQLRNDLQAKDNRIAELEAAQTGAVAATETSVDVAEFEAQIAENETIITRLQGDLSSARAQVEELRQRESERAQQVMRQGLSGRVLAVNQGWNFVVLNLGDRNGVVNNAEMLVQRGNQLVGKIRITSVEPSTSIADIVVNSVPRGLSIQPGDQVIYAGAAN
jgi:myosin heavy subunit